MAPTGIGAIAVATGAQAATSAIDSMGVLWASVGASRPYETFTGLAEVAAGVLLFIPGLTTFGALLCLTVLVQKPRATRALVAAQLVFGTYLVGVNLYNAKQNWDRYGGGAPKPVLYGIWTVEEIAFNGEIHPPLLTDRARWRRVVIQALTVVSVQRVDDTYVDYPSSTDIASPRDPAAQDVGPIRDGTSDVRPADARAAGPRRRRGRRSCLCAAATGDRNSFLLVNRGFRWVQERPFNR